MTQFMWRYTKYLPKSHKQGVPFLMNNDLLSTDGRWAVLIYGQVMLTNVHPVVAPRTTGEKMNDSSNPVESYWIPHVHNIHHIWKGNSKLFNLIVLWPEMNILDEHWIGLLYLMQWAAVITQFSAMIDPPQVWYHELPLWYCRET